MKRRYQQRFRGAEKGAEQYPFSSTMLIRKADLLIATHKYRDALSLLDHAAMLDSTDINVYILKTDAYLALDKQEKAVKFLSRLLLFLPAKKEYLFFLNWQMCMTITRNLKKCLTA
jgi:tetratricopeptide (TPR) repeat protein